MDLTCKHIRLPHLWLLTGSFRAPYPVPKNQSSHPGHIPLIAAKVAELQQVPLDVVLTQVRKNTKDMYQI